MAREIAREIRVQLTPQEQAGLARAPRSIDPEAYQAYLQGRYYQNRQLPGMTEKAIAYFEEAVGRDPRFALAYVGLAESGLFGHPAKETMPRAKAAALKAVEINPKLAEAHAALALVQTLWDWDWAEAEKSFERAIALGPSLAETHHRYSHYLAATGRFEEAIAESKRALELDPLSTNISHYLGRIYYFSRQYDNAIEQYRKTLELDPQSYWAHFFLAVAYEQERMYEQAAEQWGRTYALSVGSGGGPAPPRLEGDFVEALRKASTPAGYQEFLRMVLEWQKRAVRGPVESSGLALLCARLGEKDEAFRWLEKSFESHARDLIYLKVDPQYDSLRTDPRFAELVRRIGLPTH